MAYEHIGGGAYPGGIRRQFQPGRFMEQRGIRDAANAAAQGPGAATGPLSVDNVTAARADTGEVNRIPGGVNVRHGGANVAGRALAQATQAGGELGEPTSWKGGEGAPEGPVVMRGTTQTYQGANVSPETGMYTSGEFATPQQARMSWHRDQANEMTKQLNAEAAAEGPNATPPSDTATPAPSVEERVREAHGEYRPPGQTLAEIMQTREGPGAREEREARAEEARMRASALKKAEDDANKKALSKDFEGKYTAEYGPPPKIGEAGYQHYFDAHQHALEQGNPEAGIDYHRQTKDIERTYKPLFNDESLKALGLKESVTMNDLKRLEEINPKLARKTYLKLGPALLDAQSKEGPLDNRGIAARFGWWKSKPSAPPAAPTTPGTTAPGEEQKLAL